MSRNWPSGWRDRRVAGPHPDGTRDGAIRSPYRGLRSFAASAGDAALFFGRDLEQELIAANLLASRLTLLYGPSGVGKSSILCAGVVHRLRRPAPSLLAAPRRAVVYVDAWHGDPHEAILAAVREEAQRLGGGETAPSTGSSASLDEALGEWSTHLDAQLLLVLDQFEQYFLHHPPVGARRFDEELAATIAATDLRVRCLVSLREDALVGLDRFKGHIPGLFENRLRLRGLTEQGALEAIHRPLEQWSDPVVTLEPGLAEEVVRELQSDGTLLARGQGATSAAEQARAQDARIEPSHLQLVMEALWARELGGGSRSLRLDTLVAMGGWAEIVCAHVDSGLDGLPAKQRGVAARASRYLVTPSGMKVAHSPSDLASYTDEPVALTGETLERLCALRILRPLPPSEGSGESRYEVFHDLLAEPILDWGTRFEARRQANRVRWLLAALIAAVAAVLTIGLYSINPGSLERLELSTIDTRFSIRGPVPADRDIVIVTLDQRSLRAMNHGKFDLGLRPYQARLIDLLLRGNPRVIAYDISFSKEGTKDEPLLAAMRRAAGKMVLVTETLEPEEPTAEPELVLFGEVLPAGGFKSEVGVHPSYGRLVEDSRGIYRWVQPTAPGSSLPSFAMQTATVAAGGHPPPKFSERALIDYHGSARTFATVSMIDVLHGKVPPAYFAHKIVLVGVSAQAGKDIDPVPGFSGKQMPGTEIQANAISSIRNGPSLRMTSTVATVLLIIAFSLLALLVVPLAWWATTICFLALAGAYLLLCQLLFDGGLVLPIVYPLLALALAALATALARIYISRSRRRRPRA
jgi:CHASE2 domain-containing sensor protein